MCELLMGVEYDVYHSMMYFLLYLNFMKLLNYYGEVVGDYICLCAYILLVNFYTCNGVELLVYACHEKC